MIPARPMFQDVAIAALVVAMMAAVGLDLAPADALAGLRKRGILAAAFVANVVLMPALVVWLSDLLALPRGLAIGLLVGAVAPGGPTGPLFTRIAGADLGFATSLQVLLSVAALLTAPLSLELLGGEGSGSLLWPMARALALFQLLPLALGIALRVLREPLARRLARPVGLVANGLLLAVIVGLMVSRGAELLTQSLRVHLMMIGLSTLPCALALAWPAAAGARPTLLAAGLVTTVRNMSVALLLSASFFAEEPLVDGAILVWGFYMLALPGLLVWRLGARARGSAIVAEAQQ